MQTILYEIDALFLQSNETEDWIEYFVQKISICIIWNVQFETVATAFVKLSRFEWCQKVLNAPKKFKEL